MTTLDEKRAAYQAAIQRRDGLKKQLSELPELENTLVRELAGVGSKSEGTKKRRELTDLELDKQVLPLQLENAKLEIMEAEKDLRVAEIEDLEVRSAPIREEEHEATQKASYWAGVAEQKKSNADGIGYQVNRKRGEVQKLNKAIKERG